MQLQIYIIFEECVYVMLSLNPNLQIVKFV